MKERILKIGVPLLLVAVLVAAGAYPLTSSQAASKTTYTVVLQKGSGSLSLVSINDGAMAPQTENSEAVTFKIVVENKLKTEKVKSTKGKASYYPVTLLAKSYKGPTTEFPMIGGGGIAVKAGYVKGDAKGKLYTEGGDVDVKVVQGEKKAKYVIGDGKADPAGSMLIVVNTGSSLTMKETGKKFMDTVQTVYFTTASSSMTISGVKGGLNGKALPEGDTTKTLPKPLVGEPVDLDAGTGTWVGCSGIMNVKNKSVGIIDYATGRIWVMKISK